MNIVRENPPLLIPASALVFNADGTRVAVLDATQHVHFQPVEVEGDFGTDVGISFGLKLDDRIIANPGARLNDGEQVQIDEPKKKGTGCAAEAGGKLRMKESHEVRPSQSPWPRVMRRVGQPIGRSVHRGTAGPCIELRKHSSAVADLIPSWGRQQ